MKKLLFYFLFFPTFSFAQVKLYSNQLSIIHQKDSLNNAFIGGFNSPQFGKIHLNSDTILDLVVFEKSANKLYTFLAVNNNWVYSPIYESFFPSDIQNWLIVRDFDLDGRNDLFTHTSLGVRVFRNTTSIDAIPKFELFKENLLSTGYSGKINIQIQASDLPAIQDADNDGDLDILCFNFFNGSQVEFHQNMSQEIYQHADSLIFIRKDDCWGGFRENSCNNYDFGLDCKTNLRFQNARLEHVGGASLYLFDYNFDSLLDVWIGKETCTEINSLLNQSQNGINAQFTSLDSAFLKKNSFFNLGTFASIFHEDFDFDSQKDLILAPNVSSNYDGIDMSKNITTLLETNNQAFNFKNNQQILPSHLDFGWFAQTTLVDFDHNSQADLSVASINFSNKASIYQLINKNNQFSFSPNPIIDFPNLNILKITHEYVDYDKDQIPDLALLIQTNTEQNLLITYGKNIDFLHFEYQFDTILQTNKANYFTFYDVDLDGTHELILGLNNGKIQAYKKSNSGFILWKNNLFPNSIYSTNPVFCTANLNSNPKMDFLTTDQNQNLRYYPDFDLDTSKIFYLIPINTIENLSPYSSKIPLSASLYSSDLDKDGISEIWVGGNGGGLSLLSTSQKEILTPEIREVNHFIFPNPGQNEVFFKSEENGTLKIIDLNGKILLNNLVINELQVLSLPVKELAHGVYVIIFENEKGKKFTYKWVNF